MADELKKVNGIYMGKTFTGKTGQRKDGTTWQSFKISFKR